MKRLFVVTVLLVAWQAMSACTRASNHSAAPAGLLNHAADCACGDACATADRPPGVVIDHVPASSGSYVGSPSIAVLSDGSYVAAHDYFGPGTRSYQTVILGSPDKGEHWSRLAEIEGQWWSTLFVHQGRLFLLGTTRRFGRVVIRASSDGGRSWTTPVDSDSGLLTSEPGYHCAPVPVVEKDGRIWRAFEEVRSSDGARAPFKALVVSAPANSDLLKAASWTASRAVAGDKAWLDGDFENWLEGNVVVDRDGGIADILRVNSKSALERAAIVRVSADGASGRFDPQTGFVDFPGGSKKFTIRFDPRSKLYWSLADAVPQPHQGGHTDMIRNTLALVSSPDLRSWTERAVIFHHLDRARHAFQYVDWLFDGDDLIAVSRTAYDDDTGGAHTAHDANYLTFHRIVGFRDLKAAATDDLAAVGYEDADFILLGDGFTVEKLQEGARAFANRKYVWKDVPARLRGWRFTRISGGAAPQIRVKARRDATLTVATRLNACESVAGWEPEGSRLVYDDERSSELVVLQRRLAAGQETAVPLGTWSGAIVLIKE